MQIASFNHQNNWKSIMNIESILGYSWGSKIQSLVSKIRNCWFPPIVLQPLLPRPALDSGLICAPSAQQNATNWALFPPKEKLKLCWKVWEIQVGLIKWKCVEHLNKQQKRTGMQIIAQSFKMHNGATGYVCKHEQYLLQGSFVPFIATAWWFFLRESN